MKPVLRLHALLALAILVGFTLSPSQAAAHSLKAYHWQGAAFIVQANFGGGEAASYAKVVVLAPGDEVMEHQSGVTDGRGMFAFVPDRPGRWRIVIDAGMGHKTALVVDVPPDAVTK